MVYSENDLDMLKKITICTEQKLIFMTNILNLTKQIELSIEQDEVAFGTLFEQRQDNMNRVDKCTALINASIEQLSEHLKAPIKLSLQGHKCKEDNTLDNLAEIASKLSSMLSNTRALDAIAISAFKERHTELREKLNTVRKNNQLKSGSKAATPRFRTLG